MDPLFRGSEQRGRLPASAVTHKICLSLLVSEAGRDGEGELTNTHPFISPSRHLNALLHINSSGIKVLNTLIMIRNLALCFPSHHFSTYLFFMVSLLFPFPSVPPNHLSLSGTIKYFSRMLEVPSKSKE